MSLRTFSSAVRTSLTLLALATLIVTSSVSAQAQPSSPTQPAATFSILNFANGDTVRYDLPLLKGTALGSSSVEIHSAGSTVTWRVNGAGSWRAFVPLVQGDNEIRLTTTVGGSYLFHLTYTPQDNPYVLRLVYPMGIDSPGTYDAPAGAPHAVSNAQRRLQLTGRMLQSLTAELLYEQGQPRRTFRLLTNADGSPVVDTPRSPLTVAQLRSMEGIDLWNHFYDLFGSLPNRDKTIDVAVMADTHFDAATGTPLAHTALGGGRLALFGGGTLYSYAESVGEIEPHLLDTRAIEQGLFPEYGRRAQYWATYTTSIGAILHEVGHTFGLPHPSAPSSGDIMWRGFDYLNRAALTSEPYHGDVDPLVDIMPQWTAADVVTLGENPWLNSDGPTLSTRVTSITPTGIGPTDSITLAWTVVFANSVTGLSAANFSLVPSGAAGGSITSVYGSGARWVIAATRTGGDGTLGLNLVHATGLNKSLTNLPFVGEVYKIDTTLPNTQIDSGPPVPTNSTTATFTFSSVAGPNGAAAFQCSLDRGAFEACASPQTYSGLIDGGHSFWVRAVNAAGGFDPTPAAYGWDVDTSAPDTQIDSGPPTHSDSSYATFTFSGLDAGYSVATFVCSLDGAAYGACISPQSYSGLADGSHTFQVRAVDDAGNVDPTPAAYRWDVIAFVPDTISPETTIDGGPPDPSDTGSATFTFSGTDIGAGVAGFECSLDGGKFGTCKSPHSYSGLANGSHMFQVQAVDAIGNVDATPAGYGWLVNIPVPDTTPPDTTIHGSPPDPSDASAARFTFSGTDDGSGIGGFECSLDAGAFRACTSPHSYSSLANGGHTFEVRAVDAAGNANPTPVVYTWLIDATVPDTIPPDTTIDSFPPDPSDADTVTFTFTGTDIGSGIAGFECKLDATTFAACSSPRTYNGIADGSHTFQVRAVDASGNVDPTPATYTWALVTGTVFKDWLYLPLLKQ